MSSTDDGRPPRGPAPLATVAVVAGLAALVAAALVLPAVLPDAPDDTASSAAPTSAPVALPDEPSGEGDEDSLAPDACDELFVPDYRAELGAAGYEFSPRPFASPAGSMDPVLRAVLVAHPDRLECNWHSQGDEQAGPETSVVELGHGERREISGRLRLLGFTRDREKVELLDGEHGGSTRVLRYEREVPDATGTPSGEVHAIVRGVWFATRWSSERPLDYTDRMIESTFAGS
jgi:hypothetical protein